MPRPSHRDHLLAVGQDLIHRQGFAASGVAEITAAAGVPKGSFYNHFPSKEAFALAALEHYWEESGPPLDLLGGPGSAVERIRRHFAALGDRMAGSGYAAGCMLGNLAIEAGPLSEPIRRRAAQLFATWTQAIAVCLEEAQARGEVTDAISGEALARHLVAAWQGAVQRAKVERDARAFEAFDALLGHLLRP